MLAIAGTALWLAGVPGRGDGAALSLLLGGLFGIALQRSRFCFHCIFRDFAEGNGRPLLAILTALALGSLGYAVIFGAFLPDPFTGRLAPDAHIGPVSWVLVLAGFAFGLGMLLSGSCISGHLYRLGEGSGRAPFAILGTVVGFGLGFLTWNDLYLAAVADAPAAWLPAWLGYGGALALQLLLLGLLAWMAWRRSPPAEAATPPQDLRGLGERIFRRRWPPLWGGLAVGLIAVAAYLRVAPLGVTAELGSLARTLGDRWGLLDQSLLGLDSFRGCATAVIQTITDNGLFVGALVAGAFAAALAAGHFRPALPTLRGAATALVGGLLLGWGAMTALGCTVGVLLSGIMAFALSGWVFGAVVFLTVVLGLKLRR